MVSSRYCLNLDVSGSLTVSMFTISVKDSGILILRLEAFTAVTMKNVVFWDIKTQFVPHRRYITSPLQSSAG
jgi:hypothetical protein